MNRNFTFIILITIVLLSSCSKDFLKSYEKRIVGTWRITDVDRVGFGGSTTNQPFSSGTITFNADGSLTYTDANNMQFQGSWDLVKKQLDDEVHQSLQVTAIDFNNQQVRTEYYDDINFVGTDHFKGTSVSSFRSYITHFKR